MHVVIKIRKWNGLKEMDKPYKPPRFHPHFTSLPALITESDVALPDIAGRNVFIFR